MGIRGAGWYGGPNTSGCEQMNRRSSRTALGEGHPMSHPHHFLSHDAPACNGDSGLGPISTPTCNACLPKFIASVPSCLSACRILIATWPFMLGQIKLRSKDSKTLPRAKERNVANSGGPCLLVRSKRSSIQLTAQAKLPGSLKAQWIGDTNPSAGWSGTNLQVWRCGPIIEGTT